jgi:hypothetical protein
VIGVERFHLIKRAVLVKQQEQEYVVKKKEIGGEE